MLTVFVWVFGACVFLNGSGLCLWGFFFFFFFFFCLGVGGGLKRIILVGLKRSRFSGWWGPKSSSISFGFVFCLLFLFLLRLLALS